MIVKNNTNGKKFNFPKEAYQKLSNIQKQNFEIITENDTETTQVVANEVKPEAKKGKQVTPPDSGDKKENIAE